MSEKAVMSRRAFLGGAALAGASAGAAGLFGCSPSTPEAMSGAAKSSDGSEDSVYQQLSKGMNPQDDGYATNSGDLSHILSSWKMGGLEFDNRIVKSSAGSGYGLASWECLVEYYERFAKGDVKMIWVETLFHIFTDYGCSKHVGVDVVADTYDFDELISRVHDAGAKIGIQIGTESSDFISGINARGEAQAAENLTAEEIQYAIECYVNAAKVVKGLGFDALEINCAGENLPQWFLSGANNHREDEYGGQTYEGRVRFLVDVVQGIRAECGEDWPIELLINGIEENDESIGQNDGANTVEDGVEMAKLLEAAGVSAFQVRLGPLHKHIGQFMGDLYFNAKGCYGATGYGTQFDFDRHFQGKVIGDYYGCGMMLDIAAQYKESLSVPVGTVTYMDPAHAPDLFDQAVADGKVDYLVMNRALNVDSDYVLKLEEGRLDEVRPCSRCGHCFTDQTKENMLTFGGYGTSDACRVDAVRSFIGGRGLPGSWDPDPADGEKSVMVVGAGPAGMEAARVAGQRGYSVTLYDKKSSLGGLLAFASVIKGPKENLEQLTSWFSRQLELEGVEVVTGQEVDAGFIEEKAPDVVILALGGIRDTTGISGDDATHVISIDDVANADIGQNVTIVGSNMQATDIAFYLLAEGKNVTIVTSDTADYVAKGQANWLKQLIVPMLYARGVRVWSEAELAEVGGGQAVVRTKAGAEVAYACDTMIEALDMLPNKDMANDLSGMDVRTVGDCDDPWNIQYAIRAGNFAAREI